MFQNNLAFEIADQYSDRPMEFLKSLYDISFYVPGTYAETWKIIMENGNSLKRYLTCFYFETKYKFLIIFLYFLKCGSIPKFV